MKRSGFKKKPYKMKKSPLRKKSRKLTIPRLRDKVWAVFSLFIRSKGSVDGFNRCVTCGVTLPITELHAGHFIHGKNKATYLEEDNVHPQCVKCNLYLSGNLLEYYPFMENEYGTIRIEELKIAHKKEHIWKRQDLEDKYVYYKEKVREVLDD